MKTHPHPNPSPRRLKSVLALAAGFMLSLPAFGGTPGTWYSIRTNGVLVQKADNSRVTFGTAEVGTRALADNQIRRIR